MTITNPYVGPRTFTEAEANRFFGREREARDLRAMVLAERLVLFYAQSGAGKSSLVNTRLIPQLRDEEGFEVLPVGRVSGDLPEGVEAHEVKNIYSFNLNLSLSQSDTALSPAELRRLAGLTLAEFLGGSEEIEAEDMPGGTPDSDDEEEYVYEDVPYLLMIDQFEEIVTTHPGRWPERAAFFEQLRQALARHPNLWVVLVMREDFVAALDPYLQLLSNRLRARYYMQRMGVEAALQAIKLPAEQAGWGFTDEAATHLVDNLRRIRRQVGLGQTDEAVPAGHSLGQYVEPVQLQVVCYQLWENCTRNVEALDEGQPEITMADLGEYGDVDTALADFYEEALNQTLAATDLPEITLRRWFEEELITEAGTRGTVYQGEETTAGLPNPAVKSLTDQFLLRAEPRAGGIWVELVHDRFVDPIRQANQRWETERMQRNPLMRAAQLWLAAGRSEEKLLSGLQLREAEQYAAAFPRDVTTEEQHFLEESLRHEAEREAERRAEARRERNQIVAGLVALVVLAAAAFWGWSSASWARLAENQALEQAAIAATAKIEAETQANAAVTAEAKAVTQADIAEQRAKEAATAQAIAVANEQEAARQADIAATRAAEAEVERNAAKSAHQRTLAVQIETLLDNDPQLAALIALESRQIFRSDEAERVLAKAPYKFPPLEATLLDHTLAVLGVAWSPDGSQLASGAADNTVRIWDLETSRSATLNGHTDWVREVAWSPDGQQLASASDDTIVKIWNVADQTSKDLKGHQDFVLSLAWSPDGKYLASGDRHGQVNVWDMTASPIVTMPLKIEHSAHVWGLAWSPDSLRLASASADHRIILWDFTTSPPLTRAITGHTDTVWGVAWSPDGSQIASAGNDRDVIIWDVQTRTRLKTLKGHRDGVYDVAWSADGTRIASGSFDRSVIIWDAASGEPIQQFERHTDTVWSVDWSPDSTKLASASTDKSIFIWDVSPHQSRTLTEHNDSVYSARWSPDGSRLASTSADETVIIRNLTTNDPPHILNDHSGLVIEADWSPDGTQLASASWDGSVIIWDGFTGDFISRLEQQQPARLWGVDWSPAGDRIAAGSQNSSVVIWDTSNLSITTPITTLLEHRRGRVLDVAWSPDGHYLASASDDNTVIIWDTETWSDFMRLDQHAAGVYSVAWSPDNKLLATGSGDKTVILWDVTDWEPVASLAGHTGSILDIAWNKDGSLLATASGGDDNPEEANKIIIWDVATRKPITTLKGHSWWIWSVEWSPDQALLTSASDDSTIQLLNTKFLQPPCEWLTQNLSYDDWQKYFPDLDYPRTCPNLPIPSDVIEDAKNFARKGQIEEAVTRLNHLNQLDSTLAIDAEGEANRIFQEAFNELIRDWAEAEGTEATEAKFEEVRAVTINRNAAEVWDRLCVEGGRLQQAEAVEEACDKAIELEPENGQYYHSRALVRQQLGNMAGAKEDLAFFEQWSQKK